MSLHQTKNKINQSYDIITGRENNKMKLTAVDFNGTKTTERAY